MPEWGTTLLLLLVLSASMSTLASLVLVSSSAVSMDLLQNVFPKLTEKQKVAHMRILCALFIALSSKPAIILSLMAGSWGTVAGAFLAPRHR